MRKITFVLWLINQQTREDRIGLLAKEVMLAGDKTTLGLTTKRKWVNFVLASGLGDAAVDVANDAWKEYLKIYPLTKNKLTKAKKEAISYLQKVIKKIERM